MMNLVETAALVPPSASPNPDAAAVGGGEGFEAALDEARGVTEAEARAEVAAEADVDASEAPEEPPPADVLPALGVDLLTLDAPSTSPVVVVSGAPASPVPSDTPADVPIDTRAVDLLPIEAPPRDAPPNRDGAPAVPLQATDPPLPPATGSMVPERPGASNDAEPATSRRIVGTAPQRAAAKPLVEEPAATAWTAEPAALRRAAEPVVGPTAADAPPPNWRATEGAASVPADAEVEPTASLGATASNHVAASAAPRAGAAAPTPAPMVPEASQAPRTPRRVATLTPASIASASPDAPPRPAFAPAAAAAPASAGAPPPPRAALEPVMPRAARPTSEAVPAPPIAGDGLASSVPVGREAPARPTPPVTATVRAGKPDVARPQGGDVPAPLVRTLEASGAVTADVAATTPAATSPVREVERPNPRAEYARRAAPDVLAAAAMMDRTSARRSAGATDETHEALATVRSARRAVARRAARAAVGPTVAAPRRLDAAGVEPAIPDRSGPESAAHDPSEPVALQPADHAEGSPPAQPAAGDADHGLVPEAPDAAPSRRPAPRTPVTPPADLDVHAVDRAVRQASVDHAVNRMTMRRAEMTVQVPDFGDITARAWQLDGEVAVEVVTAAADAAGVLHSARPAMERHLREQAVEVRDLQVLEDATRDGAAHHGATHDQPRGGARRDHDGRGRRHARREAGAPPEASPARKSVRIVL